MKTDEQIIETVLHSVSSVWPPDRWIGLNTIVAVSGGPDSVALLNALVKTRERHLAQAPSHTAIGKLIIAHVNHGQRGEQSDADARFVSDLATQLELPCEIFHPENDDAQVAENPLGGDRNEFNSESDNETSVTGQASEASMRDFRYRCLRRAAAKHAARYIVTGHTLDDQVETILFRIFRGTGIRGLTGIPAFRNLRDTLTLVRPLLSITRQQTRDFLNSVGCGFRTDPSNDDSMYSRNFLRNELLPIVRTRFPDVDAALARLGEQAAEHQQENAVVAQQAETAVTVVSEHEITINCESLRNLASGSICEILIQAWDDIRWSRGNINRATWQQVAELIKDNTPRKQVINLPGPVRACKSDGLLRLTHGKQSRSC